MKNATVRRIGQAIRAGTPLIFAVGIVSILCTVTRASQYSDQVIADGAIHYWRFEESTTAEAAKDEISGVAGQTNNPGTYQGGITVGQASGGVGLGTAIRLDGANGTHVALGTPQHPGDSISVEAWVNLDVDATASFSPIVARWDGSYELDVNATDQPGLGTDRVDFVLRNDTNAFGDPASPAALTRGQWHHVVGVYDATTGNGTVYLDGVAGAPFALGGNLQNAGGDDGQWYIGTTRGPASGFAWDGLIDEVAIYPGALTSEQVQNHIRLASIPEPSSLILLAVGLVSWSLSRRRKLFSYSS
jgi:hypothetical protein